MGVHPAQPEAAPQVAGAALQVTQVAQRFLSAHGMIFGHF